MHQLLQKITSNPRYSQQDKTFIQDAYKLAAAAHFGQKRSSGEDYIVHPLSVAYFLSELGLDIDTIVACLLHDTIEDTTLNKGDIEDKFGKDVAFLVEGVTKLTKIEKGDNAKAMLTSLNFLATDERCGTDHFNSLKKMFFAMAKDIRVILIKLADRYHNMMTLRHLPADHQEKIALETLEIYAPIAARLGMGRLKGILEDLAFPVVYPQEYSWLIKKMKERYSGRLSYIESTKPIIRKYLADAGIKIISIDSRAKHYYSLYQKLERRDMDLNKIFDLVAMRIIVPDIRSCYETLGVIHKHYKPLPGLIKDYIALPKPNGYQSLHTTIFCEEGRIVEIQIRTENMHEYAENGIAAHWAYSESGKKKNLSASPMEVQWVSQLKNFLKNIHSGKGLTNLKIDFFKNRIFVFTPKGEVKDLPEEATPIDFAYSVHTELGNGIKGAKVNGRMVSLSHELKSGDVVEIIKGKNAKPSLDWLKIVKTALARKLIRARLKDSIAVPETASKKKRIGPKRERVPAPTAIIGTEIPLIDGQYGIMYKLAKCCNPAASKKIKGFMTISSGVSIHAATCTNIRQANKNRVLGAAWAKTKSSR